MRILIGLFVAQCLFASTGAGTPDVTSFNGIWRQQVSAKSAKTRKPKELLIKTDGSNLAVKVTGSGKVAMVDVVFQIGGPVVTYNGLDGDQFTLKATFEDAALKLDGTELEDGQVLTIHEVWTTKTEGNIQTLVDTRTTKNDRGNSTRTTVYERVQP